MKFNHYIFILFITFLTACSSSKQSKSSYPKINKKVATELTNKEQVHFKFLFMNASKERILGNYEKAANLFLQCTQLAGGEPAPYYELANIFELVKEPTLFLNNAEKAAKLDPNNYWYSVLYAHALQGAGENDKAIAQYELLLKKNPQDIDILFDIATIQYYSGNYADAIKTLNKVEKKMGISEDISFQKQRMWIKLNNVDKAADEIKALIIAYPDNVLYQVKLADLYSANDMPDKAFEIYKGIIAVDPNNAFANLSLHDYYKNKGEKEKAFDALKKAFASPELDIDTKMQILLSYYAATESDNTLKKDAFELNKIMIQTHPKDAKSYTIYADFLYRDKKLEGAKENYLKAIEFDASKFPIWSQLMFIESELKDNEALIRDSEKAMELFPNQPIFYYFNGATHLQEKNYKDAIASLEIGKAFVIDNPPLKTQFHATLGDAYNSLKEYEKSDAAYEDALKLDPKNIYVLNNYAYYLSLREDKLERAAELSEKCNDIEPDQANYQDTYAWILYKQGKFVQAKDWLEKALENGGANNAVILEHLGDTYAQLNNLDKALELWKRAKKAGKGTEFLDKKIASKKLYE